MPFRRVQVTIPASSTGYSEAARLRDLEPTGRITRVVVRHTAAQQATVVTVTIAKHASSTPSNWAVSDKVWEYTGLSISGSSATDLDHNTLAVVFGAPYPDDGNPLWIAVNVTTTSGGGSTSLLVTVEADAEGNG